MSAQVRLGPIAGVNFANLNGDDDSHNAMKLGFHLGGLASIHITNNLLFEPQVLFSMKGSQDSDDSKIKTNLNYIDVPFLIKYRFNNGINLFAGPDFALLLSAKVDNGNETIDIKDNVKSIDFGFNFGAGYEFENGLGFSLKYNMGLANVSDLKNYEIMNTVIGVSAYLLLGGN